MRNGQPSQSQLKIEGRPISDSDNETYILHTWLSLAPFIFLSHVLRGQPHHNQLCKLQLQLPVLATTTDKFIYIYIYKAASYFLLLSFFHDSQFVGLDKIQAKSFECDYLPLLIASLL